MSDQPANSAPIGLIGVGLVGRALAERFLNAGWQVIGCDVSPREHARTDGPRRASGFRNHLKSRLPSTESMSVSVPQQGAGELNESEVIEPVFVVADEECAALRQPSQRAFDHPAARF